MIHVVVGGQHGSESKGNCCAYLAGKYPGAMHVRVCGPNAGHSVVDSKGRKWALRQIPVAAVIDSSADLVIAQGSEIDAEVLWGEIRSLEHAGYSVRGRMYVDGMAAIIEDAHKQEERAAGIERNGSTVKGIGAVRADLCLRKAGLWRDVEPEKAAKTAWLLRAAARAGRTIVIEGTQGYGLGIWNGRYPHVTSSDTGVSAFLSRAGLSGLEAPVRPWVVLRTYPIRIAGNSGELLNETTWEAIGVEPEYTTVTKKMRRVGKWDAVLAREAVQANGGWQAKVWLSFLDYIDPEIKGATRKEDLTEKAWEWIDKVGDEVGSVVMVVGTGPSTWVEL